MKRIRLLSALLACLAAVATGLPAFASMATVVQSDSMVADSMVADSTVSGAPSHCMDCPDCQTDHCAQMVHCTAPCAASIPVLPFVTIEVQRTEVSSQTWPFNPPILTGECPSPEPLPPRS